MAHGRRCVAPHHSFRTLEDDLIASAEAAVREAPGTTFKLTDLLARPVPRFKIMSPLSDEVQRGGRAVVKIAIEATPDPIKAIRVQVDGREIGSYECLRRSGGDRQRHDRERLRLCGLEVPAPIR
jgi:hypothetical protein